MIYKFNSIVKTHLVGRLISLGLAAALFFTTLPVKAFNFRLPNANAAPKVLLKLNQPADFACLKAIKLNPDNPLQFDFIIEEGNSKLSSDDLKAESDKLIGYFFAALTIPQKDLWVNLSPYEEKRVIPLELAKTEMGADFLAQDYLLKQLSASLSYPDSPIGKKFWDKIKAKSNQLGLAKISADTFSKIWITPDKAIVYETKDGAFISEASLKVMMEEDYLAASQQKLQISNNKLQIKDDSNRFATEIMKEVILPVVEDEVNRGERFAKLRQIYSALILAFWFKDKLRKSLDTSGVALSQAANERSEQSSEGEKDSPEVAKRGFLNPLVTAYLDQNKTAGIDTADPQIKEKVYQAYLSAFKKGAYRYVKKEFDASRKKYVRRRYFSGGVDVTAFAPKILPASPLTVQSEFSHTRPLHKATAIGDQITSPDSASATADRPELGQQVGNLTYRDGLIRKLWQVKKHNDKSGQTAWDIEEISDRGIVEWLIKYLEQPDNREPMLKEMYKRGPPLINETYTEDGLGTKIIRISDKVKKTQLGRSLKRFIFSADGAKAINYRGFDNRFKIVGFDSALADEVLEHETTEISFRELGFTWIEAHNLTVLKIGKGTLLGNDREKNIQLPPQDLSIEVQTYLSIMLAIRSITRDREYGQATCIERSLELFYRLKALNIDAKIYATEDPKNQPGKKKKYVHTYLVVGDHVLDVHPEGLGADEDAKAIRKHLITEVIVLDKDQAKKYWHYRGKPAEKIGWANGSLSAASQSKQRQKTPQIIKARSIELGASTGKKSLSKLITEFITAISGPPNNEANGAHEKLLQAFWAEDPKGQIVIDGLGALKQHLLKAELKSDIIYFLVDLCVRKESDDWLAFEVLKVLQDVYEERPLTLATFMEKCLEDKELPQIRRKFMQYLLKKSKSQPAEKPDLSSLEENNHTNNNNHKQPYHSDGLNQLVVALTPKEKDKTKERETPGQKQVEYIFHRIAGHKKASQFIAQGFNQDNFKTTLGEYFQKADLPGRGIILNSMKQAGLIVDAGRKTYRFTDQGIAAILEVVFFYEYENFIGKVDSNYGRFGGSRRSLAELAEDDTISFNQEATPTKGFTTTLYPHGSHAFNIFKRLYKDLPKANGAKKIFQESLSKRSAKRLEIFLTSPKQPLSLDYICKHTDPKKFIPDNNDLVEHKPFTPPAWYKNGVKVGHYERQAHFLLESYVFYPEVDSNSRAVLVWLDNKVTDNMVDKLFTKLKLTNTAFAKSLVPPSLGRQLIEEFFRRVKDKRMPLHWEKLGLILPKNTIPATWQEIMARFGLKDSAVSLAKETFVPGAKLVRPDRALYKIIQRFSVEQRLPINWQLTRGQEQFLEELKAKQLGLTTTPEAEDLATTLKSIRANSDKNGIAITPETKQKAIGIYQKALNSFVEQVNALGGITVPEEKAQIKIMVTHLFGNCVTSKARWGIFPKKMSFIKAYLATTEKGSTSPSDIDLFVSYELLKRAPSEFLLDDLPLKETTLNTLNRIRRNIYKEFGVVINPELLPDSIVPIPAPIAIEKVTGQRLVTLNSDAQLKISAKNLFEVQESKTLNLFSEFTNLDKNTIKESLQRIDYKNYRLFIKIFYKLFSLGSGELFNQPSEVFFVLQELKTLDNQAKFCRAILLLKEKGQLDDISIKRINHFWQGQDVTRGLEDLKINHPQFYLDLMQTIQGFIDKGKKPKILAIGVGRGLLPVGLLRKFGSGIEVTSLNLEDQSILFTEVELAEKLGISELKAGSYLDQIKQNYISHDLIQGLADFNTQYDVIIIPNEVLAYIPDNLLKIVSPLAKHSLTNQGKLFAIIRGLSLESSQKKLSDFISSLWGWKAYNDKKTEYLLFETTKQPGMADLNNHLSLESSSLGIDRKSYANYYKTKPATKLNKPIKGFNKGHKISDGGGLDEFQAKKDNADGIAPQTGPKKQSSASETDNYDPSITNGEVHIREENYFKIAIDWAKYILKNHKNEFGGNKLVFIGGSTEPAFITAKVLAQSYGVDPNNIIYFDLPRDVAIGTTDKMLYSYLKQLGLINNTPIAIIDIASFSGNTLKRVAGILSKKDNNRKIIKHVLHPFNGPQKDITYYSSSFSNKLNDFAAAARFFDGDDIDEVGEWTGQEITDVWARNQMLVGYIARGREVRRQYLTADEVIKFLEVMPTNKPIESIAPSDFPAEVWPIFKKVIHLLHNTGLFFHNNVKAKAVLVSILQQWQARDLNPKLHQRQKEIFNRLLEAEKNTSLKGGLDYSLTKIEVNNSELSQYVGTGLYPAGHKRPVRVRTIQLDPNFLGLKPRLIKLEKITDPCLIFSIPE